MIARLEDRARRPDQQLVNSTLIDVLDPRPGEHLLEVGCGSGVLDRLAAARANCSGTITGVDISYDFTKAALTNDTDTNAAVHIQFSTSRAEELPFPARIFDKVFAARLLLHVADPEKVVREMVRVVKPSGRVVVMDWDFDTVVVDHSNRELTRRLVHWRTDHMGGNNWSGRKLFRHLADAGLSDLRLLPVVSIASGEQDSLVQSLWNAAQGARDQNIITAAEYQAWTDEVKSAMKAGHFFASIIYFVASGKRA